MTGYKKLTVDYENYLLHLIFGREFNLEVCVDLAYLDFNRTLRGISKIVGKEAIHDGAKGRIIGVLEQLRAESNSMNQSKFDDWHRNACQAIKSTYPSDCNFSAGQAQKWLNMSLKYIYTLGDEKIPGFRLVYAYCHAPLDNVFIASLKMFGFGKLTKAWSQIDYEEYFNHQRWIRTKFAPVPPLEVEFWLWMGKEIPPCTGATP